MLRNTRRSFLLAAGAGAAAAGLQGCGSGRQPADEAAGAGQPTLPEQVASFSALPADGSLPAGWKLSKTWLSSKKTDYTTVLKDDTTVVQGVSDGSASAIYCDVHITPEKAQRVRWRWMTDQLMPQADVSIGDRDDAVARIIVSLDSNGTKLKFRDMLFAESAGLLTGVKLPHSTLIYVWDTNHPPGSVFGISETSRIRYLVVESGPEHLGQWRSYERDFHADFAKVFDGETPGTITSVGITTDSNNTNASAQAWYGDITVDSA